MRIVLSFVIFIIMQSVLYSFDIHEKLKDIDSNMYQGTVVWKDNSTYSIKSGQPEKVTVTLIYDKDRYKRIVKYPDTAKVPDVDYFFDGKDFFEYRGGSKILTRDTPIEGGPSKFMQMSNMPNLRYGRGLSLAKNVSFDEKTNTLTGDIGRYKVVARLDPKYDYAMSDAVLTPDVPGHKTDIIIKNSKPILVDNKYYIYSETELGLAGDRMRKLQITKATFKKPDERSYTFLDKSPEVVDARTRVPILYNKGQVPEGMSSEELLKKTKNESDRILKRSAEIEKEEQKTAKFRLIYTVLTTICMLVLIMLIIRRIKKKS